MRHYVIDYEDAGAIRIISRCSLPQAVRLAQRLGGDVVGYVRDEPDEAEIAREVEKELAWAARK